MKPDPANWGLPLVLGVLTLFAAGSFVSAYTHHARQARDQVAIERGQPAPSGESVRVRHLLVMYQGSQRALPTITRSKPEARARAEQAINRLLSGSDFDDVAREFTDEPGGAARGGDLGRITRGMTVARFEEAAFSLRPGQSSGVVESEFGFHVIQRLANDR